MTGVIFDVKEFAAHDGPGLRTTVFVKGCPLRCAWCHNPEGLKTERQLLYKEAACDHCGACRRGCGHPECAPFGRCLRICPKGCLSVSGEEVEAAALAKRLLRNEDFFRATGGGVTVSGGEPLLWADFVCELAENLGSVHKALETSGYADPETYRRVAGSFDYVMQDIKLADDGSHRRYTGVGNEGILRNAEWLKGSGIPFVFRVPLIPGITDTEGNLEAISRIVGNCRTELLSYNELAGAKYGMLGMRYPLPPGKNRREDFAGYFENAELLA